MSDDPAPVVITVSRPLSMMDGFRFGYGACSAVTVFALIAMCCARVLNWVGL